MSTITALLATLGWALIWVMCIAVAIGLYWLPTIVALLRRAPDLAVTVVLNFFGVSIVCWIVALVMALRSAPSAQINVVNNAAPPYGSIPPSLRPGPADDWQAPPQQPPSSWS